MDTIITFMPLDLRLALATKQPLPNRVQVAVLFADISVHTLLSAVLAQPQCV